MIDLLDDVQTVALTATLEAGGREPLDGLIAVPQVIGWRVRDRRWPDTWREVCLQRKPGSKYGQFSCWNPGTDISATGLELARLIHEGRPLGSYQRLYSEALYVATGVMAGVFRDLVNRSCHYHTVAVKPAWASGRTPVVKIGRHLFYSDIP